MILSSAIFLKESLKMIDAGTILQMIRMEHHITRHELAKQFGTTYEAIKEIEDNNGDVPDEWLIYLYNNYDLSPEELYLLEYISDMPVVDNTEVIHTYKGYTAVARGRHSFSIRNADGIEVMHTSSRAKKVMTTADMENAIDSFLLLLTAFDEAEDNV